MSLKSGWKKWLRKIKKEPFQKLLYELHSAAADMKAVLSAAPGNYKGRAELKDEINNRHRAMLMVRNKARQLGFILKPSVEAT